MSWLNDTETALTALMTSSFPRPAPSGVTLALSRLRSSAVFAAAAVLKWHLLKWFFSLTIGEKEKIAPIGVILSPLLIEEIF
jgi:hypothetical protein